MKQRGFADDFILQRLCQFTYIEDRRNLRSCTLELGGMTKNVYHGIFQNYSGFTVYDGIFFMHDRVEILQQIDLECPILLP